MSLKIVTVYFPYAFRGDRDYYLSLEEARKVQDKYCRKNHERSDIPIQTHPALYDEETGKYFIMGEITVK